MWPPARPRRRPTTALAPPDGRTPLDVSAGDSVGDVAFAAAAGPPAAVAESIGALTHRYREGLVGVPLPEHPGARRVAVAATVEAWLHADGVGPDARAALLRDLVDDLVGLGPLEQVLADPACTEILVTGTEPIRVEVDGGLRETSARFRDTDQVRSVLDRLLAASGRRVDDGQPIVDARLGDGSRINAVLPPVAVGGPHLTIRRPRSRAFDLGDLITAGSLGGRTASFLHACVLARRTLVVTGGAGSGKTTLLAALAGLVPHQERLVVLEDTAELLIDHPHQARLECRPAGRDGVGEVSMRDLVRASLRMRPDRIVVGEVRGAEAADMVQALNTGHNGSLATLHANSADDAIERLAAMLAMAWPGLGEAVLRRWIGLAVDVVVHTARTAAGRRVIAEVACVGADAGPVSGIGAGAPVAIPVFRREPTNDAPLSTVGAPRGRLLPGMRAHGVDIPESFFVPGAPA